MTSAQVSAGTATTTDLFDAQSALTTAKLEPGARPVRAEHCPGAAGPGHRRPVTACRARHIRRSHWRPSHSPWLVGLTVTLATFMEVLDTSIANVALPHIAGGLSASLDESTWVLTSYLVSNAIVLPISGWFSSRIGRKRFYMICVALFTLSTFLCGLAPNLHSLIFFRVLQGIGGGGLAAERAGHPGRHLRAPAARHGLRDVRPGGGVRAGDRPDAGRLHRRTTRAGGGSSTSTSRWASSRCSSARSWSRTRRGCEKEKEESEGVKVDWLGLGLVAVAFGSLQIVLDKGQQDDWFSSPLIVVFTMVMVICWWGRWSGNGRTPIPSSTCGCS